MQGLRLLKFDQIADRAGISRALQAAGTRMDAAGVLSAVVFWWIFLYFIEMALNALALPTITAYINQVLAYIPNVVAAILIIVVGALIANVAAGATRGAAAEAGLLTGRMLGGIVRWAILLFAGLAALTQLNIAQNMIFILFAAIVGMLALAGGRAFGLGGRDTASRIVSGMYESGKQAAPRMQQMATSDTSRLQSAVASRDYRKVTAADEYGATSNDDYSKNTQPSSGQRG